MGRAVPLTIQLGDLGERDWEVIKFPQLGPGRRPGRKWIYAYLRSERNHLEHFLSLSDGRAPKRYEMMGPGKTFPIPTSPVLTCLSTISLTRKK